MFYSTWVHVNGFLQVNLESYKHMKARLKCDFALLFHLQLPHSQYRLIYYTVLLCCCLTDKTILCVLCLGQSLSYTTPLKSPSQLYYWYTGEMALPAQWPLPHSVCDHGAGTRSAECSEPAPRSGGGKWNTHINPSFFVRMPSWKPWEAFYLFCVFCYIHF